MRGNRVRYLTPGQVNRVLKPIPAGIVRPAMPNTIIRQMLRPFRGNDIRTALRTLIDWYSIHRTLLPIASLQGNHHQGCVTKAYVAPNPKVNWLGEPRWITNGEWAAEP